jgi:hypothetical protein
VQVDAGRVGGVKARQPPVVDARVKDAQLDVHATC